MPTTTTDTAPEFASIVVAEAAGREAAAQIPALRARGDFRNGNVHEQAAQIMARNGITYREARHPDMVAAVLRGIQTGTPIARTF